MPSMIYTPQIRESCVLCFFSFPLSTLFQGSSHIRPNGDWLALKVAARPVCLQESGLAVPDEAASEKQMLADWQHHLSFNCPSKTGWKASLCARVVSSDSGAGSKRFSTVRPLLARLGQVQHGEQSSLESPAECALLALVYQ